MRSHRGFLAIAVLLLAPVLAGCGEDDDPENSPPTSSSPDLPDASNAETSATTSEATSEATTDTSAGLPPACDVLTPADVEAAFGVPFGEPSLGGGGTTEQDIVWQSDDCNFEAEDLVEVDFALTGPDDFTAGEFQCPEPRAIASTVTPVEVPGAVEAWWDRDDAPPLEATLRVCTEAYIFDIDLEYEDGVDFQGDPMQQSIALAETALGVLGG
ncbi:hypothetical protein [Nocardioides bizhenqiangii]|uniref:DUF3558 domain-containing protein n=1 Tax=Nocardioides bizhenqiangii TaxID=3095076 RepID=A0ABZ0ZQT0_9ACTN|nr:hypothetical protein [Nocardioides sp. HM61]WQQ26598.1 hypothetical protein SHK19_21915 [Nocardioides sp. HM61]